MSPTYRLTLTHSGQAAWQGARVTDCTDLDDARTLARELIGRACAETPPAADRAARASYRDALLRMVDTMPTSGARFILPNRSAVAIEATHPFMVPVVFAFTDTDAESAYETIVQMVKDDPRAQFVGSTLTAMGSTLDDPDLDVTVKECGDEARCAPRWQLVARWTENAHPTYGDDADGEAHVSLYRAGDERIEFAFYPWMTEEIERGDELVCRGVESCVTSWTVQFRPGDDNDYGRDMADMRYETADPLTYTLEGAQARAAKLNARNLCAVYI